MVSFPNNHEVFLLKMISTWGVKWGGNPPFKETAISLHTCFKSPPVIMFQGSQTVPSMESSVFHITRIEYPTVDASEIRRENHLGCIKPGVNIGSSTTNLNWLAGFLPSTVVMFGESGGVLLFPRFLLKHIFLFTRTYHANIIVRKVFFVIQGFGGLDLPLATGKPPKGCHAFTVHTIWVFPKMVGFLDNHWFSY